MPGTNAHSHKGLAARAILAASLAMSVVLSPTAAQADVGLFDARIVDDKLFMANGSSEVGARPNGSFGAYGDVPTGYHPGDVDQLGFMADRDGDGDWSTGDIDGDFFTPGRAFEGWALQVGSDVAEWNRDSHIIGIPGAFTSVSTSPNPSAVWESSPSAGITTTEGIAVRQTYSLPADGRQTISMVVQITNASPTAKEVHYMRAVDPDNCQIKSQLATFICDDDGDGVADDYLGTFTTLNKVAGQRLDGSSTTAVTSSQLDGSLLALWTEDEDSVALSDAPKLNVQGSFCDSVPDLKGLYEAPRTYSPDVAGQFVATNNCYTGAPVDGTYFNHVGSEAWIDGPIFLIVKKTVPAGGSVDFTVYYSLTAAAFNAGVSGDDAGDNGSVIPPQILLPNGVPVISGALQAGGVVTCTAPEFSRAVDSVTFTWTVGGVSSSSAARASAPFTASLTLPAGTPANTVVRCDVAASASGAVSSVAATAVTGAAAPTPPAPTPPTPTQPVPPADTKPVQSTKCLAPAKASIPAVSVAIFRSGVGTLNAAERAAVRTDVGRGCAGSFLVTGYVQPTANKANDATLSRARARSAVAVLRSTHPNATFKIAVGGDTVIKQCIDANNRCATIQRIR
jgi:hypothetical protein